MVPRREEIRYTLYEGGVVRGFTEVQTVHPVTQNPKWGGDANQMQYGFGEMD